MISIEASGWASTWLLGRGSRVYSVRYIDSAGNEHFVRCITSGWMGVFFTDDRVLNCADPPKTLESLDAENRRLREENEMLKRRLNDRDSTAIKE